MLTGKNVAVLGGTGSIGHALVQRLLADDCVLGRAARITVFSRDEVKQSEMRLTFDDDRLRFVIGDARHFDSVYAAVRDAHLIVFAAALKQVPSCEFAPWEAVQTNVIGAENVVRAVVQGTNGDQIVIGVSTDKAVKPVNVMGATKLLQERVFIKAAHTTGRRFALVRYGNVLNSRGSVIPLFQQQIQRGGPVTVTTPEMTRFLLSLDQAVDTIFTAVRLGGRGEVWVPVIPSARVVDVARVMIGSRSVTLSFTGVRPGEKTHEVLVSEEELPRTREERREGRFYIVSSMLAPAAVPHADVLKAEYSSAHALLAPSQIESLLRENKLIEAT